MLTPIQLDLIKATTPVVAANAAAITETFYPLMFEAHPEVRAVFNQSHQRSGAQPQALANAIIAYAANIDRLGALGPAVKSIVEKHVSLNITPDQYKIVGECLMAAIGQVLGEAVTPEIANAWEAAYWQLANILIDAEETEYASNESRPGGWRGPRSFRVVRKIPESSVITSFHLAPVDGMSVLEYRAGQYLGLKLTIDGQTVHRNYSLSAPSNGKFYRISVKREPHGLASNHLHDRVNVGDEIELYPPAGEFVLRNDDSDLLLISGGVGQTPMIPMLEQGLNAGRRIAYLHAALNSAVHAFRNHVDALARKHNNLYRVYCYSDPLRGDDCEATGFLTDTLLDRLLAGSGTVDAYVVGPRPLMDLAVSGLRRLGVPADRINYEFFGPKEPLALDAS
jgi:nitric oxide dioxygenase